MAFAASALVALASNAHADPVTQSTLPASAYSDNSNYHLANLGSVTLPNGTNTILALTSTATLVDQGWGGSDPTNGVTISLLDDGKSLWRTYVAGAGHTQSTQTYDLSNDPAPLLALNTALGNVDWMADPTVTMEMDTTPWPYPGWSMSVSNASFTVTSDTTQVPEPSALALLGTSLILGVSAFR